MSEFLPQKPQVTHLESRRFPLPPTNVPRKMEIKLKVLINLKRIGIFPADIICFILINPFESAVGFRGMRGRYCDTEKALRIKVTLRSSRTKSRAQQDRLVSALLIGFCFGYKQHPQMLMVNKWITRASLNIHERQLRITAKS